LLNVPPGFSPDHVWTASIQLPQRQQNASSSFFENLTNRISAFSSVKSASAGDIPFSPDGTWTADLYFPGRPAPSVRPSAVFDMVLTDYFKTLQIPLLEGRVFSSEDRASTRTVAIVSRAFVQKYFPAEDPIGKKVANNATKDKPYIIVGVVGDVANRDLAWSPKPEIYLSASQFPQSAMFLVVREAPNYDVTQAVRSELHSLAPNVALFDVETMPARILDSVKVRRFVAWLLDSFALVGLLLAALGLYGTLAHLVELRRREIAIRMALGASAGSVKSLVARASLSLALMGLIPGAILAVIAIRAARSFLFGVSELDVWSAAATILAVMALALAASWIPVMRAARINALAALREE
jgi:putative ABC transport system permease protein